ncbi:hypothetical protein FRB90_001546 [Tulasnella sp. 427]|nr:hypothetical protein FRB90_001546 [Tulasnella sp. 427]
MPPYQYELPTTGAISFTDICIDGTGSYTVALVEATTARANLRSILKEHRHGAGEKDYLRIIKTADTYLPHIYSIIACVTAGELSLRNSPVFSWRSTLSSRGFATPSSRTDVPSLYADLVFTLLTLAYAYSNLSSVILAAIGLYELERTISDAERKAKDEKLNFAANLLARASGVYEHLAEKVLPEWDKATGATKIERPPELAKVVVTALAKMAVADANQLAIRKLMTRSAYDSTLTPGPPLPQSHPPTSLLGKLYIHASSLYSSALSLVNAASPTSNDSKEVNSNLRNYLLEESTFCSAMSHRWFGVDAGEASDRCGEGVTFLTWSKSELESLKESKLKLSVGAKTSKEEKAAKKDRLADELDSAKVFLKYYQKMNDSVHFCPVPCNAEIRGKVPEGRAAIQPKPYTPPMPCFGPTSEEGLQRQAEALSLQESSGRNPDAYEEASGAD